MLIDTHAHLSDPAYYGLGSHEITTRQIIDSMRADGLEKIITIGYDAPSSYGASEIAREFADVFCAVGIHPSEADKGLDLYSDCEKIENLARQNKCVAVGEIGLDYHYESTRKEAQKALLEMQIDIVKKVNKPVIFHVRDAYGDMLDIVKARILSLPKLGVMHCFSGSAEMAKIYIDMGFYISFSGSITFKNASNLAQVAKNLPRDRVLVETDCPYLTPVPFRGALNRPAYVKYQAEKLAEIWGVTREEVEAQTTLNARRCFSL